MRMGAGVDSAKGVDMDMCVDLGRFQAGVAEHFLNIADVGSAAVHVGGAGVAEKVASTGFVDATAPHELLDPIAQIDRGDPGAVAAEEHRSLAREVVETRTGIAQITAEPGGGSLADGKHPAFSSLATADVEGLVAWIEIAEVEVGEFGPTNTGGVEKLQDRTVSQAKGICGIGNREKETDFLGAEGLRQKACLFPGKVEVCGWIGGYDTCAA